MRTRVKICCISSSEEAQLAISLGADALGLVGDMPSGPGIISDTLARDIAQRVPPPVATFLLTSRDEADDIADHVRFCGVNTVQIVRHIDPREYPRLREALPAVSLVQVIHVEDRSAIDLIDAYEPYVDAFLLDSGRPGHAELGGTGRIHDWEVSAEFLHQCGRPVFLAGGLNPTNVTQAISAVRPYGVDLCSGVRTDGALDPTKLADFMTAVRAADTARSRIV